MKQKTFFIIFLLSLLVFPLKAQHTKSDFRIIGYYSARSAMNDFKGFPFKRVTHVNLFFLNPDSLGNFSRDYSALEPFVSKAHKKNVKVLFSIAGGSSHPYYHNLLKEDNRAVFIQNLVSVVLRYNLDGIDVDIEGSDIDENYEVFVVELGQALKAKNKLMTAAIAVYYKDQFSDRALAQYDFVNVMVYDRTGPWSPEKPGQHSSYDNAVEDLEYFGIERKIPREKMVLGVPFYGYGFGPEITSPPKSMNFNEIVTAFPGSENADEWKMADGMIMYYNGIPTIKKKTVLAKEKASGIMIWQLSGDAHGSKSLLKVINKTAYSSK
jgi:chitinase